MKRMWKAVALTFIGPGLGHFYLAKPLKGLVLLTGTIIVSLIMIYEIQPAGIQFYGIQPLGIKPYFCIIASIVLLLYSVSDVLKITHALNIN